MAYCKRVVSFHMLLLFTVALFITCYAYEVNRYALLMPNVRPTVPELYLCTPVKVNTTKSFYIVGFEPNATMNTAHHMLLYGCKTPGSSDSIWNCGEMVHSKLSMKSSSPCSTGSQIIYAWARDAPPLALPEGVGFKVGGTSEIQYLVLQVHYAHIDKFTDGSTDDSGVFLHYTERPLDKLAGVYLLGTSGVIPAHKVEHMETMCKIEEDKTIYPFAYRTHTHSLGRVVSGYRVRQNADGSDEWTLLGKRDPLTPQMFYPLLNNVTISFGDMLAARCTMESDRDNPTVIGSTNKDEMCNFYLMYYVEHTTPLNQKYCFSSGPPFYYWNDSTNLNHIPEDASELDK